MRLLRKDGGGLSGMVQSFGWGQAFSVTAHVAAGSGSQPVFGAVVDPDSRWRPGRPAIAKMGTLPACLGPAPHAGQVGCHHASTLICAESWMQHACAHGLMRLPVYFCIVDTVGESRDLVAGKHVG